MRALLASCLLPCAAGPVLAAWTDASTPLLSGSDRSAAAAWGDDDGDGDPDLYVTYLVGQNVLFRNDDGAFADAGRDLLAVTDSSAGTAWADADNDGDLDLFLATTGQDRLFLNGGSGAFVAGVGPSTPETSQGLSVAWADYDRDGFVDLYVANGALQPKTLYRNLGGGVLEDVTPALLADTGPGRGVAWGDYDDDGDQDLYVSNRGAPNRIYRNEGDGTFADPLLPLLEDPGFGYAVDWVDIDNDLDLDLSLVNNGPNQLFRNEGGGLFTDVTAASGAWPDSSFGHGSAWADFDADGDVDFYLVNNNAANRMLRNDGDGVFVDAPGAAPLLIDAGGNAAAAADYDGDGDLDLYVTNDWTGNRLFRNDATPGNHWFQVDLVGTASNRSAIGAKVRARTALGWQVRWVNGGSGFFSQGAMTVAFGLGPATRVDSLLVSWPSGIQETLEDLAADQRITLVEPDLTGAPESPTDAVSAALRLAPNPFHASTTLRLDVDRAADARVEILGVGGRLVRELRAAPGPSPRLLTWDGRDGSGQPVTAGVYFVRVRAGGTVTSGRVVRLK
jgi:hypothetical protein